MEPALVFAVSVHAALQRLQVREKIAMCQNNAARLSRCTRSVKNFCNSASRGCVTRMHIRILGWLRARHDILEIIDDHRRRRTGELDLLAVTQDQLPSGVLNRALDEIR